MRTGPPPAGLDAELAPGTESDPGSRTPLAVGALWVSGSPDPARLSALQLRNHQCQIRVTRNHNIRSTFSK